MTMRLDKYLAGQGFGSRSEVRAMLRVGRVAVAGETIRDAGFLLNPASCVFVDGTQVAYEAALHLMLYKPTGTLTAAKDPRHPTVMDLLPKKAVAMRCMPVGRLDLDAEGLLLLTTDGALAHRLLAPRRHVDKVYYVEVDGPLVPADIDAFAQGLALSDFTAQPALLSILPGGRSAHVTIHEGKFHQVKRMFLARGRTVTRLKRLSFGGVALDAALAPGEWRPLADAELAQLQSAAGGTPNA